MKAKTFIILLIVCGLVAAGTYFSINQRQTKTDAKTEKLGKELLVNLNVNSISSFSIQDHQNSVTIKKGSKLWGVTERFAYPADFDKLTDLIRKIKSVKIGRWFKSTPAIMQRLSLYPPGKDQIPQGQRGTRITMKDAKDRSLVELIIGAKRDTGDSQGGQYLMLKGDDNVYLVDQVLAYMDKTPQDWAQKKLLDVNKKDINKVICRAPSSGEIIYTLINQGPGKPPLYENQPEGRKLKDAQLGKVFKGLSGLNIKDVLDPEKNKTTGLDQVPGLEYITKEGLVYKIWTGPCTDPKPEQKDDYYVRLEVDFSPPPKTEIQESEDDDTPKPDKPETPGKSEADLKAEAKELNAKVSAWTYIIPKWKYENFITNIDELLFPEEKESEPTPVVKSP